MALISERRQRNTNNSKHRPGIPKSVAMRIAYAWFFRHTDDHRLAPSLREGFVGVTGISGSDTGADSSHARQGIADRVKHKIKTNG